MYIISNHFTMKQQNLSVYPTYSKNMSTMADHKTLHIAMYPFFAMGHFIPFLHISNKLAKRGHRISFLFPSKVLTKFEPQNLHPHLISFIPITVPQVDGLPSGAAITADVPSSLFPSIMTAMDLTQPIVEIHLRELKPHFVFFDFTHWMPALCRKLDIRSMFYVTSGAVNVAFLLTPEKKIMEKDDLELDVIMEPPESFPPCSIRLHAHEARIVSNNTRPFGVNISLPRRLVTSLTECDVIGIKTCTELEGPYCQYLKTQYKKEVILAGPTVTESPNLVLEEPFASFVASFKPGTLILCVLGSECVLKKDQYQELVLGLELTGFPFLAALKPPTDAETTESALPEGFQMRVKGKGLVFGGWVPQELILKHPSVGCFITHCGWGSLSQSITSPCQLVFLPNGVDQAVNARMFESDLKIGVEIKKRDDGFFSRDEVCKAVRAVMDVDSQIGKEVRANHAKYRELLLREGLEDSYIDKFVQKLLATLG
ncbi:hypothetical protein K2173_010687 [Erythroxylum novogranatense]|uniref:Glycosyltransferase n=1 Tax=Erythroxylum novogranatense TaxID=1862640 RepID=A0AAV8T7A3_9ROSI|nr:hypothetical protein K2173_010687 [Erythroxylum novogranatense]